MSGDYSIPYDESDSHPTSSLDQNESAASDWKLEPDLGLSELPLYYPSLLQ